jgi:hypothetical protein
MRRMSVESTKNGLASAGTSEGPVVGDGRSPESTGSSGESAQATVSKIKATTAIRNLFIAL